MNDLKLIPDDLSIPECLKVENRPDNPPTPKEENGAMRTSAAKKIGPREAELRDRRRHFDKLKELAKPVEATLEAAVATVQARRPRAKDSFTPEQKEKLETQRQEHLKAVNGATKVKAKKADVATLPWPKPGTKNAKLLEAAVAHGKEGITWAALAKKVGWDRCNWTLGMICKKLHADLKEKDGMVFVTLKK